MTPLQQAEITFPLLPRQIIKKKKTEEKTKAEQETKAEEARKKEAENKKKAEQDRKAEEAGKQKAEEETKAEQETKAEEAGKKDDDIPPAHGLIFDSAALVDDKATESVNHQPKQEAGQDQGPSRSAVEEFIIFESCEPATG